MDRVYAEININNIFENYKYIKSLTKRETTIMAIVKANAYGVGLIKTVNLLNSIGIKHFGVVSIDEAKEVKSVCKNNNVYMLSNIFVDQLEWCIINNIVITIVDNSFTQHLINFLTSTGYNGTIKIHLKVNTGMNRFGFNDVQDIISVINRFSKYNNVVFEGIFSHLSSADSNNFYSIYQIEKFSKIVHELESINITFKYVHLLNSAGIVNFPGALSFCNMVRIGSMFYGINSTGIYSIKKNLFPVIELKTRILAINSVKKDEYIGYNMKFKTTKETKVAIIGAGFADFNFGNSDALYVIVGGKFSRVLGKICMDHCAIDVSDISGISVGDEVVFIGKQKNKMISVEAYSKMTGVQDIEVYTSMQSRVKRYYTFNRRD